MNRKDIEEQVTQAVIDRLEAGVAPWQRPWTTAGWLPTSVASGKPYRGINTLLLSAAAEKHGYVSPLWLTYRQAEKLGGQVRRGEKSTVVVLWKFLRREDKQLDKTVVNTIPLMRSFNVFNVAQVDGLTLPERFTVVREPITVDEAAKTVVDGYKDGPTITHAGQTRAFYSPQSDAITLPLVEQFDSGAGYVGTLFHELIHSTGHASRLNRFTEAAPFGCHNYAKEELVAEMGAALLAATVGTEVGIDQSAAYVQSWLGALKDDRSLIIKAAQAAQKAVDRVLGVTFEAQEPAPEGELVAA